MKKKLGQLKRNFFMLIDYFQDYLLYAKYNFGNYKNKKKEALEGKIRRQLHILEKGMSLSNPKIGFGQEKIRVLFQYLDEYIKLGYDSKNNIMDTAIGTLKAYMTYFKKKGYNNTELERKIASYGHDYGVENEFGVYTVELVELQKKMNGDFLDFFLSRHSVRQFSDKKVEITLIEKAIKLAMNAPSACNRQGTKVYVIADDEIKRTLGNELIEGNNGFANEVDKYLVVTGERMAFTDSYERNQFVVDASLFAMSLVLALHYYGIGSCILQASERKILDKKRHELLEIPKSEKIVLFIAIGHYKSEFQVAKSRRKNIEDCFVIR